MQNDHTFKLKIFTPDAKLFEGEVLSFTIPTQAGEITVLNNHAPLISLISIGEIKVKTKNGKENFLIQGGVIDVKESENFEVVILADKQINLNVEDNLEEEILRAKQAMELKQEDIDFANEEATIERNLFIKRFKGR